MNSQAINLAHDGDAIFGGGYPGDIRCIGDAHAQHGYLFINVCEGVTYRLLLPDRIPLQDDGS